MIRQYYTLYRLAREFDTQLKGFMLTECFTQEKNTLVLRFELERREHTVECSLENHTGTVYMRPQYKRARKNTADLFPLAIGDILQRVEIAQNDRVLTMHFRHINLHFQLYTGQHANVIATNSGAIIVDVFRGKKKPIGEEYTVIPPSLKPFHEAPPKSSVLKALASSDMLLGEYYAREVCQRLALDPYSFIASLSEQQMLRLFTEAMKLRAQCMEEGRGILVKDEKGASLLTLIPLHSYPTIEHEYESVNDAVRWRIIGMMQARRYERLRLDLQTHIKKNVRRLTRAIEQMENDASAQGRSLLYKRWAELLISQPQVHLHGSSVIELTDWDNHPHSIPLDPTLNLAQNAEKYFQKVRRSNEAAAVREQRLPQYKKKLQELYAHQQTLEAASTLDALETIQRLLGIEMKEQETPEKHKTDPSKFRVFDLGEGYTLYVGKNAANNDELTMRFAKQNDLWLHARGSAGSHAVLRLNDNKKPPKHILEKAAAITAYYSQARNAKYTPVVYTQRKYVRKPKGAAVGAVMLEREEVIMAEPSLPLGNSSEE